MQRSRSIFLACVLACSAACPGSAWAQESRPLGPPRDSRVAAPVLPAAKERGVVSGMVLPLVAVLGLVGVCAYAFRIAAAKGGGLLGALGAGGRAPSGVLAVLGRYPVGGGSTLVLLKMDKRVLLLCQSSGRGAGGAAMTTLCEVTDPEEVASLVMKTREQEGTAGAFERTLRESDRRASAMLNEESEPTGVAALRQRLAQIAGGAP
ncbi:MAG: hypothetical protein ACOYN0_06730 [Phycisphaerales bacterium]